jgi:stringent starvation protein B
MAMTSNKPYLVRAFYDWIVDNDCTPHVVVNAMAVGVEVPQVYVSEGQVVLNLAPRAVTAFSLNNDAISFNTRFGGVPTDIYVPIHAVIGIYARESGEGMAFDSSTPAPVEKQSLDDDPSDDPPSGPKPSGPKLRVVK